MRPLTESSRPSITIVSSSGRNARMLGTMNNPARCEPWNGVHTATSPSTPRGVSVGAWSSAGAGALAAAPAGSPPVAPSIAAAAAAPDDTSRCLPMSPPLLCATSTRPTADGVRLASAQPSRSEVSAMPRRFVPRPWTTRTRWPAAFSALPSGRRKVQCSYTPAGGRPRRGRPSLGSRRGARAAPARSSRGRRAPRAVGAPRTRSPAPTTTRA